MKIRMYVLLVVLTLSLSSCEYILDEVIDDMLYNARCEVVYQGELTFIEAGKSQMKVKVKNKGSLDASCVRVCVDLKLGKQVVESRIEYIDYLSSRSSETVIITFRSIVYGSEYDSVEVSLSWDEVEKEDYDDYDDSDW